MRILLLTPGTGHFFCGSCLRDNALRGALLELGHDVEMVPLYLPHVLEDEDRVLRDQAVRMGGINIYLQHKSRLARALPRFFLRWLDRPGLLRWASRRGNMTDAADLGEMTLSMLRGEDGHQKREVAQLASWIAEGDAPEIIVLSNVMLIGVVRALRARVPSRIVVTLQGEQPFLDALPDRFRDAAWNELRARAEDADLFFPVSESYGALMAERLGLSRERWRTLHNGIDLAAGFESEPAPLRTRTPRTIGYLARMCEDKGLHTLVDAFIELKTGTSKADFEDLCLHALGVRLREDEPFVRELEQRLQRAQLLEHVRFSPNATRSEKLSALASWSVMSVPATYGESFGLYLLEAMASCVPVVQPRHGAFEEVLGLSGAGLLCAPDDGLDLAAKLAELLREPERAQQHADAGRRAVRERFQARAMAESFVAMVSERARAAAV